MSLIKKIGLGFLAILLVGGSGLFIWSEVPVKTDQEMPDPAVVLLNSKTKTGIEFQEAYFVHEDNALHYIDAGAGEPIVFLHGFPSYWFSFLRQIEGFSGSHRVIAVDGLAAGKSDVPKDVEAYELEAMSAHIIALMDHLGEGKFHLVGHDWGSAFAIGIAQRYPDRVLSVTGISAPSINATLHAFEVSPKARESAAYVERFKQANPPLLVMLGTADDIYNGAYRPLVEEGKLSEAEGALFRNATSNPKRTNGHINWYRANLPHPDEMNESDFWPSRDARVTMPALYIWGDDDPIYNAAALDRLTELSDSSQILTIPDVGHWPHVRAAEQVTTAIAKHVTDAAAVEN